MTTFASQENYVRIDARELCNRTLRAYISTDPARIDAWVAKLQNNMSVLGDNIPAKEQTIQFLQIILDGLRHGNWPSDLV